MATRGSKPKNVINKEYGRRDYVDQDDDVSYMDTRLRVTDKAWYNEQVEKHSEFKKPYVEEDYQEMEYWNIPQLPPWWFPTWEYNIPTDSIFTENPEEYGERPIWCMINCNAGLYCDEPIGCRAVILSHWGQSWAKVSGRGQGDQRKESIYDFMIDPPPGGWTPASEALAGTADWDVVTVRMTDGNGAVCYDEEEVFCYERCICEEVTPLSYWAYNPTSMDISDETVIHVGNGCKNYSWSISGNCQGFSFDYTTTECTYNTLRTTAGACGTATIYVTDGCGTMVTGYVSVPVGGWTLIESQKCVDDSGDYIGGCICTVDLVCYDGVYKYVDSWAGGNLKFPPFWILLSCTAHCGSAMGDYCYCIGYEPKKYIVGMYYTYKYERRC